MLFREVRGCFFQEGVFRLELAVTPLQLAYALLVRHIGRDWLAYDLLPVGLHPESESGVVNTDFPRDLRYGQRVVNDSLSGLLLELRSKSSASWHGIPFLSQGILLDPLSGNGGAPHIHASFAGTLDVLLVVSSVLALAGAACSIALIRSRDFAVPQQPQLDPTPPEAVDAAA